MANSTEFGYIRINFERATDNMYCEFEAVTIVICTSNEELSLRKTVDSIIETCLPADIDKIVIGYPDFVTEGCLKTVNLLTQKYAEVPVVAYRQKRPGVGASLQEGIEMARSSHTLIIDSDCSRDADAVSRLIEAAKVNPDKICKTSRRLKKGSFHDYGKVNLAANYLGQLFLKLLFGNRCSDMTDALQIVPTEMYQSIKWEESGFPFFMEMVLKPMRLKAEYAEIPVNCYSRTEGESRNSLRQKAGYFTCAVKVRFSPIKKLIK